MDGDDGLGTLRPRYLERLRERITALEKLAGDPQGLIDPQVQAEIHRAAHSMGSSALIYGYPALAAAARKLEALFGTEAVEASMLQQHLRELIAAARDVVGAH